MKKNKTFELVYMDGYNEVRDLETQEVVFKTDDYEPELVDAVVNRWNMHKNINQCLFSGGNVDEYLLYSELCHQDEREEITEALYDYSEKIK